ncbi:ABC-type Fe3+ transport system protein [Minicystis rosea]|nr:ABC-type Fe3+ transport system protein [Minicystis rosea]
MISHRGKACFVLWAAGSLVGCDVLPTIDFQRMMNQDKFTVWQHCAFFEDGRAMRTPPEGTLPRDVPVGDPPVNQGLVGDAYVADVPIPVTRDLLGAGKARFDAFCAPCHGIRGDGESIAALNMDLRRPPALAGAGANAASFPAGRIYQIIDQGYGLMRSYAEDLISPEERWAVVAYLRALQLSHGVPLSSLPPALRQEAESRLP